MPEDYAGTGTVHETHPNERPTLLAQCYQRGHHLGESNGIGGFSACVDCGTPGAPGGLTFKDVALAPERRKVMPTSPSDASFQELMAERGMTKEERKARQEAKGKPEEPVTVSLEQATAIGVAYLAQWKTRDNVLKACGEFKIHVLDPEGQSGVNVALHQHYTEAEANRVAAEARESIAASLVASKSREVDELTAKVAELTGLLSAAESDKADMATEIAALKAPPRDPASNPQEAL